MFPAIHDSQPIWHFVGNEARGLVHEYKDKFDIQVRLLQLRPDRIFKRVFLERTAKLKLPLDGLLFEEMDLEETIDE